MARVTRSRHAARRAIDVLALALAIVGASAPAGAQRPAETPPAPLAQLSMRGLAGQWFEVARWGDAWAHRRCVADTRFVFSNVDDRRLAATRTCTTATGVEVRGGRLAGPENGSGAVRGRFVVGAFAWMPSAWSEYWVLGSGPAEEWLLIGDHSRQRLAIWSRTVALDEASVAAAIAAGRAQGFDASLLAPVAHPAGPGTLARRR